MPSRWTSVTGAFLGGVLTLLSPCSVMLRPAFFTSACSSPTTRLLSRTALFYAEGLLITLVPLGLLVGVLGSLVAQNRAALVTGAAVIVMAIGLLQIIGNEIRRGNAGDGTSAGSVFVLGSVYGVAGVFAGPVLGSVLTVAIGDPRAKSSAKWRGLIRKYWRVGPHLTVSRSRCVTLLSSLVWYLRG
ncbi:cytochrome c biogenesis CcdA family protein [Plantibacter sp. RU18]|uniref:cytochrome c biogenesis CcdA family protein n=1 Tax=Plantibacter sp. RU18 TaxID=3158143 RepID=UPI003D366096